MTHTEIQNKINAGETCIDLPAEEIALPVPPTLADRVSITDTLVNVTNKHELSSILPVGRWRILATENGDIFSIEIVTPPTPEPATDPYEVDTP